MSRAYLRSAKDFGSFLVFLRAGVSFFFCLRSSIVLEVGDTFTFEETVTMKLPLIAALSALVVSVVDGGAVELTLDDFESKISGKNGFVKFLAPW